MSWIGSGIFKNKKGLKRQKKSKRFPNSWGRLRFGGRLRQMQPDRAIDVKNGLRRRSFVRRFMINRVEGIDAKNGYYVEEQEYKEID